MVYRYREVTTVPRGATIACGCGPFGRHRTGLATITRVAFLGFAPGFPYMTGAPRELAVPRLATPRVRVPAGSVAVSTKLFLFSFGLPFQGRHSRKITD